MPYILAGPFVALIGIVAIFFVLRRKSVEKHSMYSARRSQIEHKVRAARQRTLAGHGHAEKPAEAAPAPASPFEQAQQMQPTAYFEPAARQAPPTPPPAAAPPAQPAWDTPAAPQPMPAWETPPSEPPPAAPSFDYPAAPPEPFPPAAAPPVRPEPSEPVWTPAPQPAPPAAPIEQPVAAAAPATAGWSVVTTAKEPPMSESGDRKRGKDRGGSEWQLASGDAPGLEGEDDAQVKRSSGTLVAVAQYAVLVVGLVMVLIGVLVMVANSHVS